MNLTHDQIVLEEAPGLPPHRRSLAQVVRRRPVAVLGCVLASLVCVAAYLLLTRPSATATARLCVQPAGPRVLAEERALPAGVGVYNYVRTQCAVIKSIPVLNKAVAGLRGQRLKIFQGVRDPADYLSRTLTVEAGQGDMVITVGLESPHQPDAIAVVNAVVDAYIAYQHEQQKLGALQLAESITAQKARWEKQVQEKSKALAEFRAAHGAAPLDNESMKSQLDRLARLDEQLAYAASQAAEAKAALERPAFPPPASIFDLPECLQGRPELLAIDRELSVLRASLDDQRTRLGALKDIYSDAHPVVQLAQSAIQRLTDRIAAEQAHLAQAAAAAAQSRLSEAERHQAQLRQSLARQEQALAARRERAAEYARLEGDLLRAGKLVEMLDNRIKELNVSQEVGPAAATVLEPANIPDRAQWPRQLRTIAMALALGLVIGLAFAAWRDATDPIFRSSDEIPAALDLPVLTVVPRLARKHRAPGELAVYLPSAAAAYGVGRAALALGASADARSLLVTSAASGEGSTAVAANLAAAMAANEQRVLLVDANLRNPKVHSVFGIENQLGLSSVLAGAEPVDRLITPTRVHGLEVLVAGAAPDDPAAALAGPRMRELLRELARRYDLVVIDGPHVSDIPDARFLAALSDATLIVVRANRSKRAQVVLAAESLRGCGAHLAGVIVHDAPPQRQQDATSGWCCCGIGRASSSRGDRRDRFQERQAPTAAAA